MEESGLLFALILPVVCKTVLSTFVPNASDVVYFL